MLSNFASSDRAAGATATAANTSARSRASMSFPRKRDAAINLPAAQLVNGAGVSALHCHSIVKAGVIDANPPVLGRADDVDETPLPENFIGRVVVPRVDGLGEGLVDA